MLESTLPVVMCRNEERWIAAVLRPLIATFGLAIVGDTGSTDDTLAILRPLRDAGKIHLEEYGVLDGKQVGQVRKQLAQIARARGAKWAFLVDADELYHPAALAYMQTQTLPDGCTLAFTTSMLVDEDKYGAFYAMLPPVAFSSRTALFLPEDTWTGVYPFEGMQAFNDGKPHYYFTGPAGLPAHCLHLHRTVRSRKDNEVPYRVEKRLEYSMVPLKGDFRGAPINMAEWITQEE